MFGIAGRRIAEAVVALFALLGFAFVPLGQKTAFQHTFAIFSTPAAVSAFRELADTVTRLRDRVLETVTTASAPRAEPTPEVPKLSPAKSKRTAEH